MGLGGSHEDRKLACAGVMRGYPGGTMDYVSFVRGAAGVGGKE